jgi:ATP-dependent exoDNAse (exonuclease V) alpha subunit
MIGTRQLYRIMDEVRKRKAKVILIGDPEQLQPINAGTPFKEITQQIKAAKLTEIHRQKEDWQKQASLDLAEHRIEAALNAYEVHGCIKEARDTSEAIAMLVEDYMADAVTGINTATNNNRDTISKSGEPSKNENEPSRLALAYRRKDVFAINQAIRFARLSAGELSDEVLLQTKHGKRAFAKSDRILLTENNHDLGIRNGMLGTVQKVEENSLEIILDSADGQNQRHVTIDLSSYKSFDHGYATTIHKSQGATVDKTYVLASHLMDRHLTYVAMTRHRQNANLYGDYNSLRKMQRSGETQSESKHEKQNNLNFSKLLKSHNRGPTMH